MKLNFRFSDKFDFVIKSKINTSNLSSKKTLEYVFCDEKDYEKTFKKTWWNFRSNKENEENIIEKTEIFIEENEKFLELNQWYFESNENIFYDYSDIQFKLNNWYKLEILENYNNKSFLHKNNNSEEENIARYTLWYSSNSENDKIYWFWWFVKFRIYKEDKSYIFSPFFKTRNLEEEKSVENMLFDIKEELYYSLFTYKNISTSWYKIRNKKDIEKNNWSFIKIFELFYKDLEKSINNISENAKYKNVIEHEYRKYNWWKVVIDNRFIKDCLRKWYFNKQDNKLNIYWKTITNITIKSDYNNTSNKIFLDLSQTLISKLEYFLDIAEDNVNLDYLEKLKEKKNNLKWKRKLFINKYNIDLAKLSNYSLDYQHLDSKYKKFVLNYLRLFSILDLFNWDLMMANKSIDQIYEYWTLIKLRDIIHNQIASDKKKNIFKIKAKKWNILFELWNNEEVKIEWKNKNVKIIYKFQQNIKTIPIWFNKINKIKTKTQIPYLRTLSAKSIPDIFVEIRDNIENNYKYLVFDAKYSSNWNIKNRFENLYKYKSWILNCKDLEWSWNEWKWKMETLEDLDVIALYPWVKNEEIEETEEEENNNEDVQESYEVENLSDKLVRLYEKSVKDIWFWAYIMNPDKEDFGKIEELIKSKIN